MFNLSKSPDLDRVPGSNFVSGKNNFTCPNTRPRPFQPAHEVWITRGSVSGMSTASRCAAWSGVAGMGVRKILETPQTWPSNEQSNTPSILTSKRSAAFSALPGSLSMAEAKAQVVAANAQCTAPRRSGRRRSPLLQKMLQQLSHRRSGSSHRFLSPAVHGC